MRARAVRTSTGRAEYTHTRTHLEHPRTAGRPCTVLCYAFHGHIPYNSTTVSTINNTDRLHPNTSISRVQTFSFGWFQSLATKPAAENIPPTCLLSTGCVLKNRLNPVHVDPKRTTRNRVLESHTSRRKTGTSNSRPPTSRPTNPPSTMNADGRIG